MTIDTLGRSHKPAGSPASTGGQFAAQAAPGQSATLEQPTSIGQALDRISSARRELRAATVESRQATASALAAIARSTGSDVVDPEAVAFADYGVGYNEATAVSKYPITLDRLDISAIDPREAWHHTTATSHDELLEFARRIQDTDTDAALIARIERTGQALDAGCGPADQTTTVRYAEHPDRFEILQALGYFTDPDGAAITVTGADRIRQDEERQQAFAREARRLAEHERQLERGVDTR